MDWRYAVPTIHVRTVRESDVAEDKDTVSAHEAGHAVYAVATNKVRVTAIILESLDGEDWDGDVQREEIEPVTDEESCGIVMAGPCAEMRYFANDGPGKTWSFDLSDGTYPNNANFGYFETRFIDPDGNTKLEKFDFAPFGTDFNQFGKIPAAIPHRLRIYREVREWMNSDANWQAVMTVCRAVSEQPAIDGKRVELGVPDAERLINEALGRA